MKHWMILDQGQNLHHWQGLKKWCKELPENPCHKNGLDMITYFFNHIIFQPTIFSN
jgi:hypothetical protein